MSIASYIDHTILKATTTLSDIKKLCSEATTYGFAAVCVPPYFVEEASSLIQNSDVKIATVIGFPFGYHHYSAKIAEIKQAIKDKVNEVDMVTNLTALKEKDWDYLKTEIGEIAALTKQNKLVLKVIIESGVLTDEEIIRCCDLYKEFDVDFLKTSTGYADKGASVEAVSLMRKHLPSSIQIKASGGIKTFDFASDLVKAGATRLGCSSSVAIVTGEKAAEGGY